MATAQFPSTPFKHEADVDMNSFIDFDAGNSHPSPKQDSFFPRPSLETSELPDSEDFQSFSGPSHEYERYQQQTGLPPAGLTHLHAFIDEESQTLSQPTSASGNFDIPTAAFNEDNSFDSILGVTMDGFPFDEQDAPHTQPQGSHDVTQSSRQRRSLQEAYLRGPNSRLTVPNQNQFTNIQRAQSVSTPQTLHPQQILQASPQQVLQASPTGSRPPSRPHFEPQVNVDETIHRVLAKIRHDSVQSGILPDDADSQGSNTHHLAKAKKDEEEMDEDEKLLASEEGKKLSSKERRQLRNKVSARAFRHRRKEYITQLEDELKQKNTAYDELVAENLRLKKENKQIIAFVKDLLSKPAFRGHLEDLANENRFQSLNSPMAPPPPRGAASTQMMNPTTQTNMPNFGMAASPMSFQPPQQPFSQPSQPSTQASGTSGQDFDMSALSTLNLQGGNDQWGNTNNQNGAANNQWNTDGMAYDFNNLSAFAVLELPQGPSLEELRSEALSGKGNGLVSSVLDSVRESKPDFPTIREFMSRPSEKADVPTRLATLQESEPGESDFDLFCDPPIEASRQFPSNFRSEKYELVVLSSHDASKTPEERLEIMCRELETCVQHLERLI